MRFELTDSRRLTGANLYWEHPSAIIDVKIDGTPQPVIKAWEAAAGKWLDAVGYAGEKTCFRVFDGGASLLISAPIDVLYSMCELNELAWASALAACGAGEEPDPVEEIPRLTLLFDEERNPALPALQLAAQKHGVPFLWDDDAVSLGYGKTTRLWQPDELPEPSMLNWPDFSSIPVILVTGTNGKSTTVRMTSAIMAAAGLSAGLTSTDFIRVGDQVIDQGDYSGTGGARTLLRHPEAEVAILEVARGGLLRRGLGVESADVAVVTNVAADHLGEYGINTVPELIETKLVIRKALHNDAPLVLNADDAGLVGYSESLTQRIVWFSLDPDNPRIREALARREIACWLQDGWLMAAESGNQRQLVPVAEIPAARGGVAKYNIRNALAAMCSALLLGIDDIAIRKGLAAFRGDEHDNPGRGNWFERRVDGGLIRILVDFAHNEHGMRALAESVKLVPAERKILLIGQAGDRSDQDIINLTDAACSIDPDHLLVAEFPGYERGRQPFEVPKLIRQAAIRIGIPAEAIEISPSPADATATALSRAKPGDLLVLLALTQRVEALSLVHEFLKGGNSGHG